MKEPLLLRYQGGYNIIEFNNIFYAAPQSLGPIDFLNPAHLLLPGLLHGESEDQLERLIQLSEHSAVILYSREGFNIVKYGTAFFAIPQSLGSINFDIPEQLQRPEILCNDNLEDLEISVFHTPVMTKDPFIIKMGYSVAHHQGDFYAIPRSLGSINLKKPEQMQHPGILKANHLSNLKKQICHIHKTTPVEYAGWLPVFRLFGNCGSHPQFDNLSFAPEGYTFIKSEKSTPFEFQAATGRLVNSISELTASALRNGAKKDALEHFISTRDFSGQLMLPQNPELVFIPSVPFTYSQHPWVIEIEDATALFYPFVHNGQTGSISTSQITCLPIIKALIQSKNCKGIITHIKSTAENIPKLFQDERISNKVSYIPLGINLPASNLCEKGNKEWIELLFTNSWHQNPRNFFVRGGLDLLEAFSALNQKYPNIRLTLRTQLPDLGPHYQEIISQSNIRVVGGFLPENDWRELYHYSDIFILPAARIHVVSILEAMSYGMAVVVSDGWGIEEYIENGVNGMVIKGRYGKTSWMSEDGMLREDYSACYSSDPAIVNGLVHSLTLLIENPGLRQSLQQRARKDIESKYNLNNWNSGLKRVLDNAIKPRSGK